MKVFTVVGSCSAVLHIIVPDDGRDPKSIVGHNAIPAGTLGSAVFFEEVYRFCLASLIKALSQLVLKRPGRGRLCARAQAIKSECRFHLLDQLAPL
jgi:hypothetical protein